MNNLKFSYFKINFNSYYPHAYLIQNGNFIHYLPKYTIDNITDSSKILIKSHDSKILININKLQIKDKKLSTNNLYYHRKNNSKEINNDILFKDINTYIDELLKQGFSKQEIESQIKNILYKENNKQKVKTLEK